MTFLLKWDIRMPLVVSVLLDVSIAWRIFKLLKCRPGTSGVRGMTLGLNISEVEKGEGYDHIKTVLNVPRAHSYCARAKTWQNLRTQKDFRTTFSNVKEKRRC